MYPSAPRPAVNDMMGGPRPPVLLPGGPRPRPRPRPRPCPPRPKPLGEKMACSFDSLQYDYYKIDHVEIGSFGYRLY